MKKLLCIMMVLCLIMGSLIACDGDYEHKPYDGSDDGSSGVTGSPSGDSTDDPSSDVTTGEVQEPPVSNFVDKEYTFCIDGDSRDTLTVRPNGCITMLRAYTTMSVRFELENAAWFSDEQKTKLIISVSGSGMPTVLAFDLDYTALTATSDNNMTNELTSELHNKITLNKFDSIDSLSSFSSAMYLDDELQSKAAASYADGKLSITMFSSGSEAIISGAPSTSENGMISIEGELSAKIAFGDTVESAARKGTIYVAYIADARYFEISGFKCSESHNDLPAAFIDTAYTGDPECNCICSLCGERVTKAVKNAENNCHHCEYCSNPVHDYDDKYVCKNCGYNHVHEWYNGICAFCQAECPHRNVDYCTCENCGESIHDTDESCVCKYCGNTFHTLDNGSGSCICTKCGKPDHMYYEGLCYQCNEECKHTTLDAECRCLDCNSVVHKIGSNCVCTVCSAVCHDTVHPSYGYRVGCVCTKCGYVEPDGHEYNYNGTGVCILCGEACKHTEKNGCECYDCHMTFHQTDANCTCTVCGYQNMHVYPTDQEGLRTSCTCQKCGKVDTHAYTYDTTCYYCGTSCPHTTLNGCLCMDCDAEIAHNVVNCICTRCNTPMHTYTEDKFGDRTSCVCTVCGDPNGHEFYYGSCNYCGAPCPHKNIEGCRCTDCGDYDAGHTLVNCVCTKCGQVLHKYPVDIYGQRIGCVCAECGKADHDYNGKFGNACFYCREECKHLDVENCYCYDCYQDIHQWQGDECTVCHKKKEQ